MNKIDEQLRDKLAATLQAGITDEAIKAIKKAADDIVQRIQDDVEWRVKDEMAGELSWYVADMASRAVTALLDGNWQMMRRYLNCEQGQWNGRSDGASIAPKDVERQHPVIHGNLFEAECIALRRKITEAHRDLLASERILDLEDQVKSLVAQVAKLDREKKELFERLRA